MVQVVKGGGHGNSPGRSVPGRRDEACRHSQGGRGLVQEGAEGHGGGGIVSVGKRGGGARDERGQIIKGLTGCEWRLNAF